MKISIITVCRNSQKTILDTIDSVKKQRHQNVEHIIVDGASTDNTLKIIKQSGLTKVISEPDNGMYDAMNKGIEMATGDIIGILNADDVLADENVLGTIEAAFDHPEVDATFGDLVYMNKKLTKVERFWQSESFTIGCFAKGWCPPHPTFYVRKAVYDKCGLFDLNLAMGNDVELMMRFLEKYQIQSQYIPKTLVKMRMGGASNRSIQNIIVQNRCIFNSLKRNGLKPNLLRYYTGKLCHRLPQFFKKSQLAMS